MNSSQKFKHCSIYDVPFKIQVMNIKQSIRPVIEAVDSSVDSLGLETFQNQVLRPILKLQNDIIILFFEHHLSVKKIKLNFENNPNLAQDIEGVIKKDNALKIELRGLIIGHFTVDEFEIYKQDYKAFNKGILSMMTKRVVDWYS